MIYLVLFTVIVNDTASMFMGKRFGKHKLFPKVSPNKTWEGLLGGILFAIVTCFLLNIIFSINLSIIKISFLSLIIVFFAHFGDFLESLLKRKTKVKDSGNILPGHGGILDRIDSIVLNIPVAYYFFILWLFFLRSEVRGPVHWVRTKIMCKTECMPNFMHC